MPFPLVDPLRGGPRAVDETARLLRSCAYTAGSAGGRGTIVATGRANIPARSLYERLGFVRVGDREVVPGLWVTQYANLPKQHLS